MQRERNSMGWSRLSGAETAQRLPGLLEGLGAALELAVVGNRVVNCGMCADLLVPVRAR